MKKLKVNQLYRYFLLNQEEERIGYLISEGKKWLLFANIPVDYVIDGFEIVNKDFIESCSNDKDLKFKEKVIELKSRGDFETIQWNLDDTTILLNEIKESEKIISYAFDDESVVYIGKILENNTNKSSIKTLNTKAKWLKTIEIDFDKVWIIEIDSDYVISLGLVVKNEHLFR